MDYSQAYKEMRDVFDNPCVEKALKFAAEHPSLVYRKGTLEYDAVRHGFFDLYFSVSSSTAKGLGP